MRRDHKFQVTHSARSRVLGNGKPGKKFGRRKRRDYGKNKVYEAL